ncbi:MAG: TIGR04282 family arsenosugar biosynthesis glycosyltransferase [Beijerinckiaceae bacterium]|nr:TIGR04282 family arsenosugar biosynthesis glycosyltransferase [Beijerinckiaceae bacterium]
MVPAKADDRLACPVAIFARAPIAGAAKTRLIPRLGAAGAAALHARLVTHTLTQVAAARPTSATLWCSPDATHSFFADCRATFGVTLEPQHGADLGQRMHAAFVAAQGPLLLVGTDCPMLGPDLLREAAEALLNGSDAAFCPAEDGGYGLVGLRKPCPSLFDDMDWGTDRVMSETRARLRRLGLAWHETATVWDVDRPEDIGRLAAFPTLPP